MFLRMFDFHAVCWLHICWHRWRDLLLEAADAEWQLHRKEREQLRFLCEGRPFGGKAVSITKRRCIWRSKEEQRGDGGGRRHRGHRFSRTPPCAHSLDRTAPSEEARREACNDHALHPRPNRDAANSRQFQRWARRQRWTRALRQHSS